MEHVDRAAQLDRAADQHGVAAKSGRTLAKDATAPKAIKHRFDIDVAKTAPAQVSGDHDPAPEPPQMVS